MTVSYTHLGVMATKEDGIIILILYSPNTINYRNATWYTLGPISMIWTPTIIPVSYTHLSADAYAAQSDA